MKSRITLTIDPNVSHRAKRWARKNRTSVSGLVEQLLREKTGESPSEPPGVSFSKRWQGKLRLAEKKGARYRTLKEKYSR